MTKKKNDDNELFKSLLKLNIRYAIEDSNINIKMIELNQYYRLLITAIIDKLFLLYLKNLENSFSSLHWESRSG